LKNIKFENSFYSPIFVKSKQYTMRKQRTRAHIIEDLGFNHVERQILYAGFTVHRITHNDYGYDGLITTFNELGEFESGFINFQLKSTDFIKQSKTKDSFVFDLSERDLEAWLIESNMMLFVLYDAELEKAYFLDLQTYFNDNPMEFNKKRKFVRIYIPLQNIFQASIMQHIRQLKNT
jgi:hypothetical protein